MTQRASAARSLPRKPGADRGAAAVEYGLMLVAIAAVLAGVFFAFGGFVTQTFQETTNCLENVTAPHPDCKDNGTDGPESGDQRDPDRHGGPGGFGLQG